MRKPKADLPQRVRRLPTIVTTPGMESVSAAGVADPVEPTLELAPARFGLQVTIGQLTRDKLRRAQELMGHTTKPGDIAAVLDRALEALIIQLEKQKLAATEKPRTHLSTSTDPRRIPAYVKRAVRARDGDRCAHVASDGLRCEARSPLEFDHILPVARGGKATIDNVRQLCRTHNRLAAERQFGREFIRGKIAARDPSSAADTAASP